MPEAPTNLELTREAGSTQDCERQMELAQSGSAVVIKALLGNRRLCESTRAFLDRTAGLQQETADATTETLGDT